MGTSHDVAVVGAGVGGLSAAALLAHAGFSVVVAEKQDTPGGYAHGFRRGAYRFDPAVHGSPQGGPGGLLPAVLDHLGVGDRCTFTRMTEPLSVVVGGERLDFPAGLDASVAAHRAAFPGHADAVEAFLRLCHQMHVDIHTLSMNVALRDLDATADRFPTLFRYRGSTVAEVLDELVPDPRTAAFLGASWPFQGAPPSRLAFFPFAQLVANQLEGQYHCTGGYQNYTDALAEGLGRHGGELLLGRTTERILVEGGRAAGIVLDDGTELRARVVVSAVDARRTFDDLIGVEHLPVPFVRRLHRLRPSPSAFLVFAATTIDVSRHVSSHEVLLADSLDPDDDWADVEAGRPGGVWMCLPSLHDDSYAPPGEHVVSLTSMARRDVEPPWTVRREEFTQAVLRRAEQVIPGLRDSLTFLETATPETLERWMGNRDGACYGWDNVPAQTPKRLPHATPVPGLYLSGHWTQPGSGLLRALASGLHTSFMVQRELDPGRAPADFASANLPSVG